MLQYNDNQIQELQLAYTSNINGAVTFGDSEKLKTLQKNCNLGFQKYEAQKFYFRTFLLEKIHS
jgi:hypothetical protein